MAAKLFRRLSPRAFAVAALLITLVLCLYYASFTSQVSGGGGGTAAQRQNSLNGADNSNQNSIRHRMHQDNNDHDDVVVGANGKLSHADKSSSADISNKVRHFIRPRLETCPKLVASTADIDTVEVYKDFEFQPSWMNSKEYWDKSFEERYIKQKGDPKRPSLKVIIVPHSHNDPGWLKTFEHYFHYQSKQILNHMVSKMQQYNNLTFIWSEVVFLSSWWNGAHPNKQRALKALAQSGRLEITTGGWVMTDEANSHIYAMVDQLIEGHQWLKSNLDISPQSGWSIDPFGHGPTQPYLLAAAGVKGTVIQRIHYAWKQWLALKQYGDFRWIPNWRTKSTAKSSILTHNQPFDIYSIKHSCGPHPYICLNFDFRKIVGEYTEYSIKAQNINDKNVKQKAELLLEQYARTGSLFPHNVVLMPVGDDFRYNYIEEWDQQYTNYNQLINFINDNRDIYKTEISFGTPKDYFDAILERYDKYPTLKGDFFVYSDIFSEGRPAYWSGYYTTRPFMKILDRQLENSLRSAEILYAVAFNKARQNNFVPYLKVLERDFEKLVNARRNLGLFQHHDAITGTSKSYVMRDYGLKLFESIRDTESVQLDALQTLLVNASITVSMEEMKNLVLSDLERESYEKVPKKTPLNVEHGRKVVLFNSLAQPQDRLVELRVTSVNVKVLDEQRKEVPFQLNPVWNASNSNTRMQISADEYELVFVAKLPALTVATYVVAYAKPDTVADKLSMIYCNACHRKYDDSKAAERQAAAAADGEHGAAETSREVLPFLPNSKFKLKNTQPGDVLLESHRFKLLFDGSRGFLKTVTKKNTQKITQCAIGFSAYRSAQFHSGAYLFMPDPNEHDIEKDVLAQYADNVHIIITSGPVLSEVTAIYGPFLVHTVRILHGEHSALSDAIFVKNEVDFENPPKNRETELFMRIQSDIQNGAADVPEMYTDSNGFQMQKRIKVDRIGIEGNYFPVTTMAYIEDENLRLSLLTDHAQGASSWQPGYLEVMLDRRTLYDDSRGMGEGLVDNRRTVSKYWLLLEDVNNNNQQTQPKRGKREVDYRFEQSGNDNMRSFNNGIPNSVKNYSKPSLFANHLSNSLNYPVGIYVLEDIDLEPHLLTTVSLLTEHFPCDIHLLTVRTQPDAIYSQFPSANALMVVHRQGYDCSVSSRYTCDRADFMPKTSFKEVNVATIEEKSLTGLHHQATISDFTESDIESMSLQTYNVTFDK